MTNVSTYATMPNFNHHPSTVEIVPTLLLLTTSPEHPTALAGWQYAQIYCEQISKTKNFPQLFIFIYGEAAHIGNRLRWLPSDQINIAKRWQQLVIDYQLTPQICVATALARGVVDSDNAKRHQLDGENLAQGFSLVGLGELAMTLHELKKLADYKILQF